MKSKFYASLEAKRAALRSPTSFPTDIQVDESAGIIRNCAVMTIGPARGHGFYIDATSLKQCADLINADPNGLPMHFTHARREDDGVHEPETLGCDVGHIRNARVVGDSVRADVHLGEWAKALPREGDVWTYLLGKAKSDPTSFGLSAVIGYDLETVDDGNGHQKQMARIAECMAVDFVGRPAANPQGLLSQSVANVAAQKPTKKGSLEMDPQLKRVLISQYGLSPDAGDDAAQAMYDALSPEDKAACDAAKAAMSVKKPEPKPAQKTETVDYDEQKLAAETKRISNLRAAGKLLNVDESVIDLAIAEDDSLDAARKRYLAALAEKARSVQTVKVGQDNNTATLSVAISDAIRLRAGLKVEKANERALKLAQLPVLQMFQHHLYANGVTTAFELSKAKLADLLGPRALRREFGHIAALQSTSDFDNILLDAMNKTLRSAYEEQPTTWDQWARRATAPDFKNINRIALSESATPVSRTEGGEIKYSTLTDSKETYTLVEYVAGIKLTRRAIINDDMDAFSRIPQLQAASCARLEDDVAYAIITANANLADGGALFNSTAYTVGGTGHANDVTGTANLAAPTVATINATQLLMRKQKGPKAAGYLNLRPKLMLVPVALEFTAKQLISSVVDPTKSNATPNPFAMAYTIVADPRLDADSTTAWYLLADYRDGQIDTVEVCFLADEPAPVLKQETDFDTEDVKFAVRHTVAAKAIDFRGMVRNEGA